MKKKIYFVGFLCLMFDQLSKLLILNNFSLGSNKVIIDHFFYLSLVENNGAAWGSFSGKTLLLIFLSLLFLIFFVYNIEKEKTSFYEDIIYGIILGGISGNLIDRMFRGYVVDFLNFYIFGYDYPVFNFADVFIVVGIFLFLFNVLSKELKKWKRD